MKSRSESSLYPGGIPRDVTNRSKILFREQQPPFKIPSAQPRREALKEPVVEERPLIASLVESDTNGVKSESVSSLLATPIKSGAEGVGVLFVNVQQPDSLTPDYQKTLQTFAEQASKALRLVGNIKG